MMNIYINNLNKSYQTKKVLQDVSLTCPQGSFTAILGPSGCGKTTLMRCIAGFLAVDSGAIKIGDKDITHLPAQKRETAMVFQNYALWPHMSVFENIAYGLKLIKVSKEDIEARVYRILDKVEIDTSDVKKRFPSQYSGGQQQRIALARALVLEPKLLLMDEPLSNLDAKIRQRLRVEIRRLQQDLGITAVYVTHDQEEALSMADQVVIMNEGKVEQTGSPQILYQEPRSYFVAHFLGDSNTLNLISRAGKLFLGEQLVNMPSLDRLIDDKDYLLVARSKDIAISKDNTSDNNFLTLEGTLQETLFIGSSYRHWVMIGGQSIFVESELVSLKKGPCYVQIPIRKSFLYPAIGVEIE